ncbi:hypothetical protein [Plebeiibacterium sediminum]|uniref:Uncharacterized protein n=1 Tax=Plebeiibacterium sediminum TaxID=2992112 RepID=A0AAE3SHT0_9BACT|nr:hypothetical protein [Plebeiobacterium sediminum]MCW3789587.1 hypothetical protein [Plebeiobacterium sediminum]
MNWERNEHIVKISKKIYPKINKLEVPLFFVLALVTSLKEFTNLPVTIFIIAITGVLACLYFLGAFYPKDSNIYSNGAQSIIKVCMISLSVGLLGIMYKILHLPGALQMLVAATATMLVGFVTSLYYKYKTPEVTLFDNRMLLRMLIIGGICAILLLLSVINKF